MNEIDFMDNIKEKEMPSNNEQQPTTVNDPAATSSGVQDNDYYNFEENDIMDTTDPWPPPLGALEIGGCLRLCGIWVVKVPRNRGDR